MSKHKIFCLFTISCFLSTVLYAQVDTAWVRRFAGNTNGDDFVYAVKVDNQGSIYVTGSCWDSITADNIATVKYDNNGVQQWVARYHTPGGGNDRAYDLAIDNQNNIYVTGYGYDPYSVDYVTIKYNSSGQEQWVNRYGYPGLHGSDEAYAIALDNNGNVYVTGLSNGGYTSYDYATIKYNSNGQLLWVSRYNSPDSSNDYGYAIAVDNQGNVYVTGASFSDSTNFDYATIKYNADGQEQWVRRYTQSGFFEDRPYAIKVDNDGNIIVTGAAYSAMPAQKGFLTIKYNPNGDTIWTRQYNSTTGSGIAYALEIDNLNNIYVTGTSMGTSSPDYLTVKYSTDGQVQWANRYNGPLSTSYDEAHAIAIDNLNNIYVTGKSSGDYATVKYNSAGQQQWVIRYDSPTNSDDQANAIAIDASNNIHVTGRSRGTNIYYDYLTVKYIQTNAFEEPIENCELKTENLRIFPNPASSYFIIRSPLNAKLLNCATIKLFDVSGKVVKIVDVASAPSTLRVPLDGIKNGIYFVKINDEMVKEKLVVTR